MKEVPSCGKVARKGGMDEKEKVKVKGESPLGSCEQGGESPSLGFVVRGQQKGHESPYGMKPFILLLLLLLLLLFVVVVVVVGGGGGGVGVVVAVDVAVAVAVAVGKSTRWSLIKTLLEPLT
ncbi:hypothetical protein HanOQP8_Chr01g0022971 [Helianthus annuus]|nr:hypothetical protein HanOQP8_Chr01g0022971 [Helianthus annuus]